MRSILARSMSCPCHRLLRRWHSTAGSSGRSTYMCRIALLQQDSNRWADTLFQVGNNYHPSSILTCRGCSSEMPRTAAPQQHSNRWADMFRLPGSNLRNQRKVLRHWSVPRFRAIRLLGAHRAIRNAYRSLNQRSLVLQRDYAPRIDQTSWTYWTTALPFAGSFQSLAGLISKVCFRSEER